MKKVIVAIVSLFTSVSASAGTLSIAFDAKLKPVLGETLSVAANDLYCDVKEGDFSNGASFPEGTVLFSKFTNADGKLVELSAPVEAEIYPGPQPSCRAFNHFVQGAKLIELQFEQQISGIFYIVKPVR